MTKANDVWECSSCSRLQGRHDMWFEDNLCERCHENLPRCRECGTKDTKEIVESRCDAYGYGTGDWCDKCYDSDKYPYRKDRYFDPSYAGERLEDDY
jgi:hypothetical protein